MRTLLLTLALFLSGTTLAADPPDCEDGDNEQKCVERIEAFFNEDAEAQEAQAAAQAKLEEVADVVAEAPRLVATRNTGDASATTINDFLPLLRALIDSDGGFSGEDGETFGFEWSNPLGLPPEHQNKITVAFVKSELHQPLKDALVAADLEDQVATLDGMIDESGDASIGLSYSRASKSWGRDPDLHQDLLSSLLHQQDFVDSRVQAATKRMRDRKSELGRASAAEEEKPFSNIADGTARAQYIDLVEAWAAAQFVSMEELSQRLQQAGFYGLLDLVNNQPQLSLTATYRARDEIVGPDEFTAVLSYEHGWTNVNTFREYAAERSCELPVLCLADYLAREDVIADLRESRRVSVKAEYSRLKKLDFALTDPAFSFSAPATEKLSVTAGLGRYLGKVVKGRTRPRIDIAASYEDFSDDPARQNRGLATATFTYPIAAALHLSVGAVYATKPEFRGDVDAELSARAGFTYKLVEE